MVKVTDYYYDNPDDEVIWVLAENDGRYCYVSHPSDILPYAAANGDQEYFEDIERELAATGFDPAKLPHIEDADPILIRLYHNIVESENCMWFVEQEYEEGDAPWDEFEISQEEYEHRLDAEIKKYKLEAVVVKNEDALYTCYGNLQNAFSMQAFDRRPVMDKVAAALGMTINSPFLAEFKNTGTKATIMLKTDGLFIYDSSAENWVKNNTWLVMLLEEKVVKV